jgi:uncharacterized protein (DUF362 family)
LATVSLVNAHPDLDAAFARAMELAGLDDCIVPGDKVLIKPNQHGAEGYTSAAVMRAAAVWAFSQDAGGVSVGDGPNWALTNTTGYFEQTGLSRVCDEIGARALNFHAGEYTTLRPGSRDLPDIIGFSRHLCEADVIINLPVMKTHFNTLVTLGIKNLKGCLRPIDKKTLHEMELNAGLAEVARLLAPRLTATVIDATTAYEGMGPAAGTPVEMGLLIASEDIVAADAIACDLMGIDPAQVRLIRFCAERDVGEMDLGQIAVVDERVAQHRRRFELPYEAFAREFPDLRLCTEHACSGCGLNLFRALEIARSAGQEVICETVVIGPSLATEGQTLLVGKCTRDGWASLPHVPGCPPRIEAIRAALTGIATQDDVPRS